MLPRDTYFQRLMRIYVLMTFWGMRISAVVVFFGALYLLVFAHEYITREALAQEGSNQIPLLLVIAALLCAPCFLWVTRNEKF